MDICRVVPSNDSLPVDPARAPRSMSRLQRTERILIAIAMVAFGHFSYVKAETYLYQRFENRELDRILQSRQGRAEHVPAVSPAGRVEPGALIGRIEIPRLAVSAVVFAGSDAETLDRAVGHVPGTALPGAPGNVGLAGHRDTFFRRLKNVRPDDEVVITTLNGTFRYRVEGTRVVEPTDVWVLDPTPAPALTLITCYPFTYLGSAPQRFIVRAALLE
jgi:sortase A